MIKLKSLLEMKNVYAYAFEIYLKNPDTGQTGWEIQQVRVFAPNMNGAKKILKSIPDFDEIILINGQDEMSPRDAKSYAHQHDYRFLSDDELRYGER